MICASNVEAIRAAYAGGVIVGDFMPAVYVVEPTSDCALNCIMCPQSQLPSAKVGEMSVEQAEHIAAAIAPYAELVMLYFMGEPLQHSHFARFLEVMRRHIKGRLVLSTNGMALSGETLEAILEHRIDLVIACIDRFEKAAYEKIRRGGHFETVVANVESLLQARDPAVTEVVVKSLDIKMPTEEKAAFQHHWVARGGRPLIGWVDTWANQLPGLSRLNSTPAPYNPATRVACADLWFKMVVNWQGQAVMCCHNYDYSEPLGTVDSAEDLRAVWHGRRTRWLRQQHLDRNWACTSLCSGCREWAEIQELGPYVNPASDDLFLVF